LSVVDAILRHIAASMQCISICDILFTNKFKSTRFRFNRNLLESVCKVFQLWCLSVLSMLASYIHLVLFHNSVRTAARRITATVMSTRPLSVVTGTS